MHSKKWVFRELVKNENDYQGLLAYACYKMEKDKLAQDLREANKSEEEVEKDLEQFHNASVTKGQLEEFKKKGLKIMTALTEELDEGLINKHSDEIHVLKEQHQQVIKYKEKQYKKTLEKEIKIARTNIKKELLEKMQEYSLSKTSTFIKVLKWIWNGFQSVFAILILIFTLHLIAYWSSDEATKSGVISSFWGKVQSVFNNPIPSPKINLDSTNIIK
ncbi:MULTISPECIES: hypothetical protein [Proteus]|uniref:hypothetical protein n=1 Tax=Proteus TaxID=583 RepID=UPI00288AEB2B|nr:hypothetical protein [Proteus terrae]